MDVGYEKQRAILRVHACVGACAVLALRVYLGRFQAGNDGLYCEGQFFCYLAVRGWTLFTYFL